MSSIQQQYTEDQKTLADILNRHNGLTSNAKEEIAEVIVSRIYWGDNDSFFGNFLTLTALEIVKRWSKYNNVPWSVDGIKTDNCLEIKEEIVLKAKMDEFCLAHNSSPEEQLKKTVLRWLDDGLFESYLSFSLVRWFKTKDKKIYISPIISKAIKVVLIAILALTVIAFWFGKLNGILSKDMSSDCNVGLIKIRGQFITYISPEDKDESNNPKYDLTASEDVIKQLKEYSDNSNIKAILIEADSSGGSGAGAQSVMQSLKAIQKPKIAIVEEICTSACYYAISASDHIIASPLSSLGGLGVTYSYLDSVKKNEKDGLTYNALTAGKYKDLGQENKPLTDEEKALIMRDVNLMYDILVKDVSSNRKLDIAKVKQLADGSTMLGQMALDNGLIDEIGNMAEAEKYLSEKIGEKVMICR